MKNSNNKSLYKFLQEDLSLSQDALAMVRKVVETNFEPVPMILWQYGFVTLEELDRIFDWLETA